MTSFCWEEVSNFLLFGPDSVQGSLLLVERRKGRWGAVSLNCSMLTGWSKHSGSPFNPSNHFAEVLPAPPHPHTTSLHHAALSHSLHGRPNNRFSSAFLLIAVATVSEQGLYGNTLSRFFHQGRRRVSVLQTQ